MPALRKQLQEQEKAPRRLGQGRYETNISGDGGRSELRPYENNGSRGQAEWQEVAKDYCRARCTVPLPRKTAGRKEPARRRRYESNGSGGLAEWQEVAKDYCRARCTVPRLRKTAGRKEPARRRRYETNDKNKKRRPDAWVRAATKPTSTARAGARTLH